MKTARMVLIVVMVLGMVSVCMARDGIWTQKADMPTSRYVLSSSVVDGKIYAIGGDAGSRASVAEAYDPATDTWTRKTNMPMGRGAGASSVVNGRIYYMGGRLGAYGANIPSVIEYDAMTDTWATKPNMIPTPRTWLSSSVVGGKIYTIGGAVVAWGAPLSTVEEYDPATDTWTRKADMPTARLCVSTSAVNGKIYAIGGSAGYDQWYQGLTTVEEYDPATDTWTTKADMPTGRTYISTCAANGKIYAIGGVKSGGADHVSRVEEYDPATDTWTKKADIPTARSGLATSEVNGKIYAIGGWVGTGSLVSTVEECDFTPPPPDYDGNGVVNFADMCILVAYWHTDDPLCDIGPWPFGDGVIDLRDLAVFTGYWLADVGLIAHWQLDEIEGDIALDSVDDCNGTLRAGAVWEPTGGVVDGALSFDGTDDYVETPFVLNPADGPFSIFVWIKTEAPDKAIISQTGAYGVSWLGIDGEGRLVTELQGSGRGAAPLPAGSVVADGGWHRIGLSWDGVYRTLYVDDVAVVRDTSPQDLTGADGGLYFGVDKDLSSDGYFFGLMDDIRIYDRAVEP